MAVPSTQELLAAWERGRAVPRQAERALALLCAAHAEAPRAAVAALPIGARDRHLLALRRDMFGPELSALTACPACGVALELEFAAEDLGAANPDDVAAEPGAVPLSLSLDGYDVMFRLPNSLDMMTLRERDSEDENRLRLLERVVLRAGHDNEEIAASELPAALVEALEERLSREDPHADIRLNLNCAACATRWQSPFDIASYLWKEVDAWAVRLLGDVHRLARAYGWREADILALSASRRQCYLDMLDE